MFDPMKAQVGDQVLVRVQSLEGEKEVTGQISNWRNHADYVDVLIYVDLDETIKIWNENDVRDGFVTRVTPENKTNGLDKFEILA